MAGKSIRARAPEASSEAAPRAMQATGRGDTPGELALRSALHRLGLRFRVDCRPVPEIRRRADIVFRAAAVAVFMDGCFWHGCPKHGTSANLHGASWGGETE